MILGTDNAYHFEKIGKFKARIKADDFEIAGKDKNMICEHILHAADISNPLKPFELFEKWG